jgi:tetratricopeptide (TPR) repeat protein
MSAATRTTALLALLIALGYGTALRNEFVFDDRIFMQRDPRVQSLSSLPRLFVEPLWGFVDEHGRSTLHQYYRPFQLVPLAATSTFSGGAAWPCQLLDLALHLLNAVLVWVLAAQLGLAGWPALLAAALFAVWPAYSEMVLWVANVSGLGATAATLAILAVHASPSGARLGGRLATGLLFLAGLFCKETAVVAPAMMVAQDVLFPQARGPARLKRALADYAPFVPAFAVYAGLRVHALGGWIPGIEQVPLTRWELLLNGVALVPQYATTFLWPVGLTMYHDFHPVRAVGPRVWAGTALVAAGALAVALAWRRAPVVALGLLWAGTGAAPQLLVRWPELNVFAERYLYLPAVGIFIALAWTVRKASPRAVAAVAVPLLGLAVVTDARRTLEWRDELVLYRKTLAPGVRAPMIRNNLAVRLMEEGRLDEGIAVAEELLRVDAKFPRASYNLGLLYMKKGMDEPAAAAFERALQVEPGEPGALLNLGYLRDRQGRREEAAAHYLRLVTLLPRHADGWHNLAVVAMEAEQWGNARLAATRVREISPDDAAMGRLLAQLGDRLPRRRAPGDPPHAETVRRCDAARRVAAEGRHDDAVYMLRAAAWLDEASPLPHHYLANVHFLAGRRRLAARAEREALARDPGNALYRRNLGALRRAIPAPAK